MTLSHDVENASPNVIDRCRVTPDEAQIKSCTTSTWSNVFGEALSSPGCKTFRRNQKLGSLTPGGRLSEESSAWLAHHQERSHHQLERRCARLVRLRQLPPHSALQAAEKLRQLHSFSATTPRAPPLASSPPQLIAIELELLTESYSPSFWDDAPPKALGRPGVIGGLRYLSQRFLLCALCRGSQRNAGALLAKLRDRGAVFDSAFLLPPKPSEPCLPPSTLAQLGSAHGVAESDLPRRLLLVTSLELEHDEIESRQGAHILVSPTKRRPHVRLLLPHGCTSLLVPHPRLQQRQQAVTMSFIVTVLQALHHASPADWNAGFERIPDPVELKKVRIPLGPGAGIAGGLPRVSLGLGDRTQTAMHASAHTLGAGPKGSPEGSPEGSPAAAARFLVICGGRLEGCHLADLDAWSPIKASTKRSNMPPRHAASSLASSTAGSCNLPYAPHTPDSSPPQEMSIRRRRGGGSSSGSGVSSGGASAGNGRSRGCIGSGQAGLSDSRESGEPDDGGGEEDRAPIAFLLDPFTPAVCAQGIKAHL